MNTKTHLLLLLIFLLASCGGQRRAPSSVKADFSSFTVGGQELTSSEVAIALRVCLALRKKSTNFRAELLNSTFKFFIEEKDCSKKQTSEIFNTTLKEINSTLPLVFVSTRTAEYFKEVHTHDKGHLKDICPEIIKGNVPLNTVDLGAGQYVEVSFFGDDEVQLRFGENPAVNNNNLVTVSDVINMKVETNEVAAGNKIGLVSETKRFRQCTGGDEETLHQVYQEN